MKKLINNCPMCGSPAKLDSSGAIECYGKTWQNQTIECTQVNDDKCDMNLSLQADFFYVADNSADLLIDCWNGLKKNK